VFTGRGAAGRKRETLDTGARVCIGVDIKGDGTSVLAKELIGADVLCHLGRVAVNVDLGDEILGEPRTDDLEDQTEDPWRGNSEKKTDAMRVVGLNHLEQQFDGSVVLVLSLKAVQIVNQRRLLCVISHAVCPKAT